MPIPLAARLLGWFTTYQLTQLRGATNGRARAELGWKPEQPTWRDALGVE